MGNQTNIQEGGSVGGGGTYGKCWVVCQTVLWTSIYYFFDRILSYYWLRVQNCWKETYNKCVGTSSGFWGWIKKYFVQFGQQL